MNEALVISNLVLWVVVLALMLAVFALARQIGVLYERVAPHGASQPDLHPMLECDTCLTDRRIEVTKVHELFDSSAEDREAKTLTQERCGPAAARGGNENALANDLGPRRVLVVVTFKRRQVEGLEAPILEPDEQLLTYLGSPEILPLALGHP